MTLSTRFATLAPVEMLVRLLATHDDYSLTEQIKKVMVVPGTNSGTLEMIRRNCIVFGFYNGRDVTEQVRDANLPILRNTIDTYRQWMKEGKLEIPGTGRRRRPSSGGGRKDQWPLTSRAREQTPLRWFNERLFCDESRVLTRGKTHSTTIRRLAGPTRCGWRCSHYCQRFFTIIGDCVDVMGQGCSLLKQQLSFFLMGNTPRRGPPTGT